jgi:hypothetical protein
MVTYLTQTHLNINCTKKQHSVTARFTTLIHNKLTQRRTAEMYPVRAVYSQFGNVLLEIRVMLCNNLYDTVF